MTFRDIEISLTQQCMFFLYSVLLGIVTGMIYDVFRVLRIAVRHNAVTVFFEDLVFCLFVSVMLILFIFCANYGIVRWFCFFGFVGGFYLYHETVGKIVISVSDFIISFVKKYILTPVSKAVIFSIWAISRFGAYLFEKCVFYIRIVRKYLYCRRLLQKASSGFGL